MLEFFESGNCCVESGWGSRETEEAALSGFDSASRQETSVTPRSPGFPTVSILPPSREERRDSGHRGVPSLSDCEFVGICRFLCLVAVFLRRQTMTAVSHTPAGHLASRRIRRGVSWGTDEPKVQVTRVPQARLQGTSRPKQALRPCKVPLGRWQPL